MKLLPRLKREPLWKEEFSVFAADERYVSRRQFAKFLVLTSAAMFAGNIWLLIKSFARRRTSWPELPVATASDLAIGQSKTFLYPTTDDHCILIRTDERQFAAFSQKCTHLSCAVYYDTAKDVLACPCHNGYFSAKDGAVLQGPPPRPLPRIVLEQRGDQLIAVGIEAAKSQRS